MRLWDRLEGGLKKKAKSGGTPNFWWRDRRTQRIGGSRSRGCEGEEGTQGPHLPFPFPAHRTETAVSPHFPCSHQTTTVTINVPPRCPRGQTHGLSPGGRVKNSQKQKRGLFLSQPPRAPHAQTQCSPHFSSSTTSPLGVSIPHTPTPKPRPESLPALIKPLIN